MYSKNFIQPECHNGIRIMLSHIKTVKNHDINILFDYNHPKTPTASFLEMLCSIHQMHLQESSTKLMSNINISS